MVAKSAMCAAVLAAGPTARAAALQHGKVRRTAVRSRPLRRESDDTSESDAAPSPEDSTAFHSDTASLAVGSQSRIEDAYHSSRRRPSWHRLQCGLQLGHHLF